MTIQFYKNLSGESVFVDLMQNILETDERVSVIDRTSPESLCFAGSDDDLIVEDCIELWQLIADDFYGGDVPRVSNRRE